MKIRDNDGVEVSRYTVPLGPSAHICVSLGLGLEWD
jgi:hypothetical protein